MLVPLAVFCCTIHVPCLLMSTCQNALVLGMGFVSCLQLSAVLFSYAPKRLTRANSALSPNKLVLSHHNLNLVTVIAQSCHMKDRSESVLWAMPGSRRRRTSIFCKERSGDDKATGGVCRCVKCVSSHLFCIPLLLCRGLFRSGSRDPEGEDIDLLAESDLYRPGLL